MVKKAKPEKTKKTVENAERDAAGRPPRPKSTLRSERLVLRVHPDFLAVITERANEQRMTRSRFVEEVIRGVLALDPRNPRFDIHGQIDARKPVGAERQMRNPLHYLQTIAAHSALNANLFPQPGNWQMPPGWRPEDDE